MKGAWPLFKPWHFWWSELYGVSLKPKAKQGWLRGLEQRENVGFRKASQLGWSQRLLMETNKKKLEIVFQREFCADLFKMQTYLFPKRYHWLGNKIVHRLVGL